MEKKIKVMVIDDSATVRQVVSEIVNSHDDMEIMAVSSNPVLAENHLKKEWPDVFILDINMPEKDGITFLKEIMNKRPTPVVICSSYTEKNARETMEALRAGAISIITKPRLGIQEWLLESSIIISDAVKSAYRADLRKIIPKPQKKVKVHPKYSADVILSPKKVDKKIDNGQKLIAIGASAGGTRAIEKILSELPNNIPPIVIAQHIPAEFSRVFAERLNDNSELNVIEASDGKEIKNGWVYVAPGGKHMVIELKNNNYVIEIKDGPLVSRQRPSVDVLFRSVSRVAGINALGVILTGMGDDGAAGMKEMRNAGVRTIAQDEETSLVFGMPRKAIENGGVDDILPLQKISHGIIEFCGC